MQRFRTLLSPGEGRYEEKRSVFLGFAAHIRTEEEAEMFLAGLRKAHYGARHCCYAYVLGPDRKTVKCSDDGEPSQTAGQPILSVLNGEGLTDCIVAVVRYFGGTLLGTGGLIRAYTAASKDCVANAVPMTVIPGTLLKIRISYNDLGKVRYYLRQRDLEPGDILYSDAVTVMLPLDDAEVAKTEADVTDLTQGQAVIEHEGTVRIGKTEEKQLLLEEGF